jgi:hypothetical protein
MTLKEKIHKILKHNDLGISTPSALETFIGASQGAITTPMREGGNLGPALTKKLHEKARVNPEWWETGKGEIFFSRSVTKSNDMTVTGVKESFYKELIEENEEYSLIPRAILKDYKIVPEKIINMIYQDKEELKNALVAKYEMIISGQDQLIRDLRSKLGEA